MGRISGNQQKRFHGTKSICDFMQTGWQMKYCTDSGAFFGKGIYSSSATSTACLYERMRKRNTGAVFVAGVACGKAEVTAFKHEKEFSKKRQRQLNSRRAIKASEFQRFERRSKQTRSYR